MKLSMSGHMRMEQRMKLAPRMIQSMEILQLPMLALQEKIEQELNSNPVLELQEPEENTESEDQAQTATESPEREKDIKDNDFEKLSGIDEGYSEYINRSEMPRRAVSDGEPDKKLEALANTAAMPKSIHEYLGDQWRLIDAPAAVKAAGNLIIDYIDDRGYLAVRLEQLFSKDRPQITMEHLQHALDLVQRLEPAGVGARDIRECFLIQMATSGQEMAFEEQLVHDYMKELLENRLPEIARKMNCDIARIKQALARLRNLDTSPGLRIGKIENHPIITDIIIERDEHGGWDVQLTDTRLPGLRVNNYYAKLSRDKGLDDKTREFLQKNIRSAQWLMEAIEQRKGTLLKVARIVAREQGEFLDKGQMFLKPLPMSRIAGEVGVHIATVSRAVAGKYVQCPQGILPLRSFFSGGMETEEGEMRSWDAVRANMQVIVDAEDKTNPLNDDEIREKLEEAGFKDLARRTVAKYRKLLNIPSARFRKQY